MGTSPAIREYLSELNRKLKSGDVSERQHRTYTGS
jgi:hypothetical protein